MYMDQNKFVKEDMATVIGIFEDQFKKNKPLTVVKPGTQSRRFTHVSDTVQVCYYAWKKINVVIIVFQIKKVLLLKKLQNCLIQKLNILPSRKGERFASALSTHI